MVRADIGGADASRRTHQVRHRRLGAAEAVRSRQVADSERKASLELQVRSKFERMVTFDPGKTRNGVDNTVLVVGTAGGPRDTGPAGGDIDQTCEKRKCRGALKGLTAQPELPADVIIRRHRGPP